MDEDLQAFEAELRNYRPIRPSAALAQRIEAELAPAPALRSDARDGSPREAAPPVARIGTPRRLRGWLAVASLPIAAAIALLVYRAKPADRQEGREEAVTVSQPVSADPLKPIAATNVLYAATDDGVVTLADGTPARRQRLRYVDTITWRSGGASLVWSIPREEVRVVPVRYQ